MMASAADQANQLMVDRLIAEGALWSPRLIAAFRATPRHRFLDHVYIYQRKAERWRKIITRELGPEALRMVYADRALITRLSPVTPTTAETPISSSSQPSLMAQMLQDLHLNPGLKCLEVGAGTGYNAALLAHVLGPERVHAVDVDRAILADAAAHLRAFPERRVQLHHADGRDGIAAAAPFDRVMVTAATTDLEPAWLEQVRDGGMILAPLSLAPGLAYIVRGTVREGTLDGQLTRAAYFMPLRAEGETGSSDLGALPPGGEERRLPAPWAGWFERRQRFTWPGFSQALAFFGWLRGAQVHYRSLPGGQPVFGLSSPQTKGLCWLGNQEWQVNGEAGRDLAWEVWRAFLDIGGPWPTEFRFRACADRRVTLRGLKDEYVIQGPHCQHVWELVEPRDRAAWL